MKRTLLIFCVALMLLCLCVCFIKSNQIVKTISRRGFDASLGESCNLQSNSTAVASACSAQAEGSDCQSTKNLGSKVACKLSAQNYGFTTTAKSCVVMEVDSGRVLFEKDCDTHRPMASTTKIVTALTVLNNCSIDEVVIIPKEAVGIEGSSIYLREGECLTVNELLYGLMLRSGNDCAVALALHVGGSIEAFAKMMNQTAESLGCDSSNFVNPHGLHDDNHYTSAFDLAKITCEALKNDLFKQIVGTKSTKIANDGYDYPRVLVNKNKLLSTTFGADGVKTGFTKKAGRCFVGSATRNGMQVVVVVLNCGPMFEETSKMLDVAFENYSNVCIVPQNKLCGVAYCKGEASYYVCKQRFCYPLRKDEGFKRKIVIENDLQQIEIYVDGKIVASLPLTKTQ